MRRNEVADAVDAAGLRVTSNPARRLGRVRIFDEFHDDPEMSTAAEHWRNPAPETAGEIIRRRHRAAGAAVTRALPESYIGVDSGNAPLRIRPCEQGHAPPLG
ncbi:hypothetical protein [Saccharopolyspora gloriosae]|uniref:hypothetical protein n=1 Tax=Saccharopolyspora gloriosae TaxID=455344 RepID=UPI001FB640FE|nr:hypothetical protein [Saccharopolyspora gloriosae]